MHDHVCHNDPLFKSPSQGYVALEIPSTSNVLLSNVSTCLVSLNSIGEILTDFTTTSGFVLLNNFRVLATFADSFF